jgi:chromosome segregation ATPase
MKRLDEKATLAQERAEAAEARAADAEEAAERVSLALKGVDGRMDVLAATCPITHEGISAQLNRIEGLMQGVGDQHRDSTRRLHERLDDHEKALARHEEQLRHLEKYVNGRAGG